MAEIIRIQAWDFSKYLKATEKTLEYSKLPYNRSPFEEFMKKYPEIKGAAEESIW